MMMLDTIVPMLILVFYTKLNKMYKYNESTHVEDKTQLKLTSFQHTNFSLFMAVLNAEQQETKRKSTFHAGVTVNRCCSLQVKMCF
jgi:hypothetical protein